MKRTSLINRILAMLLVVIMTVQLLPLSVFAAFGDLQSATPGVDISTLKQEDAINWPIKVYDYLSDGMLFEWMDTNTTTYSGSPSLPVGSTDGNSYVVPYGGGYKAPTTVLGSDFTYDGKESGWTTDTYKNAKDSDGNYYRHYSPYYYYSSSSYGYGKSYTMTKNAAADFTSPMYLRVTDGSADAWNWPAAYFSTDQSNDGDARYMVLVYRASGVSGNGFGICLSNDTGGSSYFVRQFTTLDDSADWTYRIIDLKSLFSTTYTTIQHVWFNFLNASTTGTYSDAKSKVGLKSGAYVDFTHIGFFADTAAATNYASEALKFVKNPGEYLAHSSATFSYTHSYVTPVTRSAYLNNIFSLNYCWKNKDTTPKMFDSASNTANVRYGLDFTTHSTANGWKTNAYTSDTFWTWSNGTALSLKNTVNNVTKTESFSMSKIEVEQKTQSNGAQYVTLTSANPSKLLLSKFREDHQLVQEGYVPLTADVDYMVMVYRANGWTSSDKYGLWAHGYLDSSSPDSHKTANYWKYASLTKTSDWMSENTINQLSLSGDSGWQYALVPISETIGATDSNMSDIDRIANLGIYLPALKDGKSLDIAYVAYFKNNPNASDGNQLETAKTFGAAAVNYMNAEPTITPDANTTKSYGSSRVWYGGGNKNFGMLYSSGGGQYWPSGNSGGTSTSTNEYNYGYEFDTWMIGYRTNAYSSNSFNTPRKDPITGEAYTANYTSTSSTVFNADATGTTNNIYFLAPVYGSDDGNDDNGDYFNTADMKFDGYQILETVIAGVMTAGLLEGGLQTVTVDGMKYRVPVYRQETVEYIAYNLLYGLRIPQKDSSGNYNTRYIKGTESTKYGGVDLNGDGEIGWINYDGDSRNGNELNEASVDLATALRHELGLTPRLGNSVNVLGTSAGVDATHGTFYQKMGDYEQTLAKSKMLYGEFSDCRNAIDTAMDAAYYLLNNIFISNSYNQEQDDYDYLTLSSATVNALGHEGFAYVFDAGFTTGKTATAGTTFTDDGTNKSALDFDPYNAAGTGTGTISMEGVTGKTRFDYGTSGISWTTRFPFLPITDAEGDFAGQTQSYYFLDDAQRVYTEGSNSYKNRNFNYVIASNGEFVYREEDKLFFEFEGDDDVYLFINGELVLDIGGAHSITSVYIDVNDYVNAAATALSGLAQYGYHKDMSIEQFDEWISASEIQYLDAEFNPTGETVANTFTDAQKAEYKRQHRLNLSDGQICQFDFYYMERHGWGANMRIVTNMHITDPALSVDKSAYQFGEEIEYGGVIDPTSSVEYNFKLTNTGNTKLYNLTWKDDVLGITMDPTNGLVVDEAKNGIYVMNSSGGYLQAKDLSVRVAGTDIDGNKTDFIVTFEEENNDGGQAALKRFLAKLESNDGTQSGYDDAEITNAGSGLWVGGSVQFMGMYYMLTPEQTDARQVDNTVYLTATTRSEPTMVGNRTLRSDASHRLYTNGFPIHYQWAGHNIFMNLEHLLEQAKIEAEKDGSQLSLYQEFFKAATVSNMYTQPCDKFGRVGGDYSSFLNKYTDNAGHTGYLINYAEPGVYTFYLLMYLKSGKDDEGNSTTFASSGVNASDISEGYYAILRSQVFVADVEDSVYVLDYGLSTESLDMEGELFKNDYLFGPYGTIRAKLMGITGSAPSFIDPKLNTDATKTGISFSKDEDNRIYTNDGFFNANLAIPEGGKDIAYDANKGEYTLVGVGTVKISAVLPTDGNWDMPYLYYWYDDGTSGPTWPGTPLKALGAGKYEIDIPADVPNVIINNGSAALKTADLKITPGLESTITVTVSDSNVVSADIETIIQDVNIHVMVPADWENVYLHYWNDNGKTTTFPGDQLTEKDENGYYIITLQGGETNLVVSDGANKNSGDLKVYAGKEAWIEVSDTVSGTATDEETGDITTYYETHVKYTLSEGYVVHASVPASWKENIYLYYWHEGMTDDEMEWPGKPMTKGDLWYTYDGLVPADVSQIIINDGKDGGNHQTVDLTVTPGLETWVTVNNETVLVKDANGNTSSKYTANIAYGSESSSTGLTFTPNKFMDEANAMWMAITVHSTSATPTVLGDYIDIHNEVQMYKKITVIPATVVYYEDDFADISYNKDDVATKNTFTYMGNGSGRLTQSVKQDQPYGQDFTYQDSSNNLYSGNSLTGIQLMDTTHSAVFTFKGTGFELIGRTNATDSGSVVARVYAPSAYEEYAASYAEYQENMKLYLADTTGSVTKPAEPTKPTALKVLPVITEFDHGNDGGSEGINQVPTIRITGLDYDEYTVELSGIPTHTFDPSNNYEITGTEETYLFIDGLRIFQPMGATHDAYIDAENGAEVVEIRDLIINGQIAVGALEDDGLQLSTGTVTWTESLFGKVGKNEIYEGIQVDSTDDYLIQGPNNEVYMEGNSSNAALVFYVTKDTASSVHELQVAVRALDYAKFYGAGTSTPSAQLQYGVLTSDGKYAWKNLTSVLSSTEQYYSIPCDECPVDQYGRYQIVVRAVETNTDTPALVSYTSLKLNGLNIVDVEGVGETTLLYFENGMLVRPQYELVIIEDSSFKSVEVIPFNNNQLSLNLTRDYTYVYVRATYNGEVLDYYAVSDPGYVNSATLQKMDDTATRYPLVIPKGTGEITLTVKQPTLDELTLSYCMHTWDEGVVTKEPTCKQTGTRMHTCTECGQTKNVAIAINPNGHTYSNRVCVYCHAAEPDFYLIGSINGADYGCESDWENLGEYLFVDGTLKTTFSADSYVFVKSGDNQNWYMSEGYCTDKSVILYNTSNHTFVEANKLFVSCDVEVTFKLKMNADGSLTLSYTLPCTHDWAEGDVIKNPTCTEEGEKQITCTLCGETKTETIAATGHQYANGICSACGIYETRTIYFKNTAGWLDVRIWAWDANNTNYTGDVWPGQPMQSASGMPNLYSYELPVLATNILITNGGSDSERTGDLVVPTDGRDLYDFSTGTWSFKDYTLDYYLIGYINGADYGCEGDYANLGTYKFVDGKLTATFESDSYVFIKTTGNANWYMFEGYCNSDTGILYNTTSGLTDANKMFVPGNIELTFTLEDNGDDTFTLRYHAWGEASLTTAATCTQPGFNTYVCSLCQATLTEEIPATGHSYGSDGVCTNSGCNEVATRTIYFRNTAGWEQVYIWAYIEGGENFTGGTWPGMAMTPVEGEVNLYSYELSVKAEKVIFSNNGTPQTENLTIPTNGNDQYTYGDTWSLRSDCAHSYNRVVTTAATCTTAGVDTYTCGTCGYSFTNAVAATGHSLTDGTCTVCGITPLFFKPSDNWKEASARFAAYFFNDSSNTWLDLTDADGDGYYECALPSGYTSVIFCRMNPSTTENNWDNKWTQSGDLTLPTDGSNCFTADSGWDCTGSWSTYPVVAAASYSVRSIRSTKQVVANATAESEYIETPDMYLVGDAENALNLPAINAQLSSDVIFGELEEFDPDNAPETEKETVKIQSAAPVLSDDIIMRYYVNVPETFTDAYMVFAFNGVETVVTDYTVTADGRLCFAFEGINPQKMGDNISATLYTTVGGEVLTDTVAEFSMLAYCKNQLATSTDAKVLTLISDLLVYGAKTQVYQGYKTDKLVTEGLELTPSTFPGLDESFNKLTITGEADPAVRYTSANLILSGKMTLRLTVATADPTAYTYKITVNGVTTEYTAEDLVEAGAGKYYLYFDELKATAFDDVITAEIESNGNQISQVVTYSVNTYVQAFQNTDDVALHELLEAIYNYGKSAKAYVS